MKERLVMQGIRGETEDKGREGKHRIRCREDGGRQVMGGDTEKLVILYYT